MRSMIIRTPIQTGYGSIRHVTVSLPYVAELVDGVKYMEAKDLPSLGRSRAEGELRRNARQDACAGLSCTLPQQLPLPGCQRQQSTQIRPSSHFKRRTNFLKL
jgi:hypothetical protein